MHLKHSLITLLKLSVKTKNIFNKKWTFSKFVFFAFLMAASISNRWWMTFSYKIIWVIDWMVDLWKLNQRQWELSNTFVELGGGVDDALVYIITIAHKHVNWGLNAVKQPLGGGTQFTKPSTHGRCKPQIKSLP